MLDKTREERPYTGVVQKLRQVGLRPTRQRMALAKYLFDGPDRHVTAEILHEEVRRNNNISLATVYNALHQFTNAGLLKEVVVNSGQTYFDTNMSNHFHFYNVKEDKLSDIPPEIMDMGILPPAPKGHKYSHIELVIHVVEE